MTMLYRGPSPHFWQYIIVFLLSLLFAQWVNAQDILSSQWLPMKAQLHPAFTGPGDGVRQAGINYRQQWTDIANGYNASQAFYQGQKANMGWGVQVWQQTAGISGWQDNGIAVQLAYHQQIDDANQRLSAGVSLGGRQKRLKNTYSYDQQFIAGNGFDLNLDNGESSLLPSRSVIDWSASFAWQGGTGKGGKEKWQIGLTAAHLHQPNFSLSEQRSILASRWSALATVAIHLGGRAHLLPVIHYQQQAQQAELRFGAQLYRPLTPDLEAWIGGHVRWEDATVWQFGIQSETLAFWLSYDWNTSGLSRTTQGNGAFELGMNYCWDKRKKLKQNEISKQDRLQEILLPTSALLLPKDSDNDGVPDDLDRCPLVPGIASFSGCNDQDRDGIIDPDDSCPELFGYPDQHGCPFITQDSDLDGVPDEADYCIYIKGEARFHGCPDTDQDGVSDIDDDCPFLRGTKVNNGCPSTSVESEYSSIDTQSIILYFDKNDSSISWADQQRLKSFATKLPRGISSELLLTGHTDTEGSAAYNYTLGLERANTVYLLLHQLLPESTVVDIISYGEMLPAIVNNYNGSQDESNRRVEVRLRD